MRMWNGLKISDVVYYNGKKDTQYRVMTLYDKDGKKMCKIQSVSDTNIIIETSVQNCQKA